jgi:hypothetical protein
MTRVKSLTRVLDILLESSLSPIKNAQRLESDSDESLTRPNTTVYFPLSLTYGGGGGYRCHKRTYVRASERPAKSKRRFRRGRSVGIVGGGCGGCGGRVRAPHCLLLSQDLVVRRTSDRFLTHLLSLCPHCSRCIACLQRNSARRQHRELCFSSSSSPLSLFSSFSSFLPFLIFPVP